MGMRIGPPEDHESCDQATATLRESTQGWQQRFGDCQAALLLADRLVAERTADIRRLADERDALRRDLDLALEANRTMVEGSDLAEQEIERLRAVQEHQDWQTEEIERLRAELERVRSNHVTVAEEVQRRHDAVAPLAAEIEQLRADHDALDRIAAGHLQACVAAEQEVERLRTAGNTMSAYIYSISQPASIPAVIRQAMQAL